MLNFLIFFKIFINNFFLYHFFKKKLIFNKKRFKLHNFLFFVNKNYFAKLKPFNFKKLKISKLCAKNLRF